MTAPGPLLLALLLAGDESDTPQSSVDRATPVAIVSAQSGPVSLVDSRKGRRDLRRFDWLRPGSVVETGPGSTLVLVFRDGRRWGMGPRASVLIAPSGIERALGEVRPLPPLSPLPQAMGGAEGVGGRPGAVRIRGVRLSGLYPHDGASALADRTVLRFVPVATGSRYHVEVEAEDGSMVFETETTTGDVAVPPGTLKAGSRYYWRVRSVDLEPAARGRASFQTLDLEPAEARAALRARLEGETDASSGAFLAEIDRSLGLLWEAREGFRAALALSADEGVRASLEQTERALANTDDQP